MRRLIPAFAFLSSVTMAEVRVPQPRPVPASTSLRASTRQEGTTQGFGYFEVRPGWDTRKGNYNSENCAELGLKFDKLRVSYNQDISTQVSTSADAWSPVIDDGFFRLHFPKVWTNGTLSFDDQFRVYLPTSKAKREAGMVTQLRNYFIFTQKISDSATFIFSEIPVVHLYNEAGTNSAAGSAANPAFENRVVLEVDFNLSKSVTLYLPLFFYAKRYRNYQAKAANNEQWEPSLFVWPELRFAVTPGFSIGAAYRTNSFIKVTDEGTVPGDGGGVAQAVFAVSF